MTELRLISSAAATPVAPPKTKANPFSVTAIGSCRIVGPLRIMQQTPSMTLNQSGVYGYSHSCTEIRQHLTHLLEGTRPPKNLMSVLGRGQDAKAYDQPQHKRSDFYVFELSSAKQISIDGHPIQLNYLNRHFRKFFSDKERARAFWKHAKHSNLAAMKGFLSNVPEYKVLSNADQKLLRLTRLQMTTPEQLRRDIDAIRLDAPDHLFVTHFDAVATNGAPLKARAEYLKMTREALTDCGATWYDPSPSVHAFDQSLAIEDPEKSLSHYSHAFEQYLSSDWWMRFIDPVRQQRRLANSTKARIRQKAIAATAARDKAKPCFEKV